MNRLIKIPILFWLAAALVGFGIHGMAVQLMNNMIIWKITAHSCFIVLGSLGSVFSIKLLLKSVARS